MSISAKITAFFISQGIVPDEDREVYEYGFELLLADLFNFVSVRRKQPLRVHRKQPILVH